MKTGFTREVHYPAPGSSPLLRSSKSVRHIVRQAVRPARVRASGGTVTATLLLGDTTVATATTP